MTDDTSGDDISLIEARIAELAEAIERCRKFSLAARIAIGAGAAWLALVLLGLIPYEPFEIVAAPALMIGGVVLLGSNSTTWAQTESALAASEAMRADMIGRMQLRVVGEKPPTLH